MDVRAAKEAVEPAVSQPPLNRRTLAPCKPAHYSRSRPLKSTVQQHPLITSPDVPYYRMIVVLLMECLGSCIPQTSTSDRGIKPAE